MRFSLLPSVIFAAGAQAVTLSTTTAAYTVSADSANPLVVAFSRTNCDITSLVYRGREVQYKSTGSHIGSGLAQLGTVSVAAQSISSMVLPKYRRVDFMLIRR